MAGQLTRREREVAALVAEGETNRAIGQRLFLSERTVEGHVFSSLNKLGLNNRAELASWITQNSLRETPAGDVQLPVQITPIIGRDKERIEVERLLGHHRLVTVSGPGGVGKTRLAVAMAAAQSHWPRVRMVDLAPLNDEAHLDVAIAMALDVPTIEDALDDLRAIPTLLLLDNCEHLVGAAGRTAARLLRSTQPTRSAGRSATVLVATSRAPLDIEGERVYALAPLGLRESVALFEERAHQNELPHFDVEQICKRLDGLPLAVELAAARTRVMSTAKLRASLSASTDVLAEGHRDKHRSLEASIRWSYNLLSSRGRAVFRALSVFEGPFELEAGASIARATQETVLSLVDHSLVIREGDRYRLLYPIREFARAELELAGDHDSIRGDHAHHFAALVEIPPGSGPWEPRKGRDVKTWLKQIEADLHDVRLMLDWYLAHEPSRGSELAAAMYPFWSLSGLSAEGRRWLDAFLVFAPDGSETKWRILEGLTALCMEQEDRPAAARYCQACLAVARQRGDSEEECMALVNESGMRLGDGDLAGARGLLEAAEALVRSGLQGYPAVLATRIRGLILALSGELQAGRARLEESIRLCLTMGWETAVPYDLALVGAIAIAQGDITAARESARRGLDFCRAYGSRRDAIYCLDLVAGVAAAEHEFARALEFAAASASIRDSTGQATPPAWQNVVARWMLPAKQSLGERDLAAAWKMGESMTYHDAIDAAQRAMGSASS